MIDYVPVDGVSVFRGIVNGRIVGVEGLGHVQAVQPHLMGVGLLVPEAPFAGAGMVLELVAQGLHGGHPAGIAGAVVEDEEGVAGADVVGVEVGLLVLVDDAGGVHRSFVPVLHVIENVLIPGSLAVCLPYFEEGHQLEAGGVVPLEPSLHPVEVCAVGAAGHLSADHAQGIGLAVNAGAP